MPHDSQRLRVAIAAVAFVAGLALVALGTTVFVIARPHSPPAKHLTTRTHAVPATSWPLMWYNVASGNCLTSNLGLGTNNASAWPDVATQVPCTQRHLEEVFFAGNLWPTSTKYPGDSAVSKTSDARCRAAFAAYVGIDISQSALSYDYWAPTGGDWDLGDRQVICVAYDPGVPLSTSVEGTGM